MGWETQYYEHGRFKVAGGVLPNAITAYRTRGSPENPCIVFPTCYGAKMDLGSASFSLRLLYYIRNREKVRITMSAEMIR